MGKGREAQIKNLLAREDHAASLGGLVGGAVGGANLANMANVYRSATATQATYTKANTVTS